MLLDSVNPCYDICICDMPQPLTTLLLSMAAGGAVFAVLTDTTWTSENL